MENLPNNNLENENESLERIENVRRLEEYLADERNKILAEFDALQKNKSPEDKIGISRDFRIIPPASQYIERDKRFVEHAFENNYGTSDVADVKAKQKPMEGFQFELLKTAIMHKYAGSRLIALRSSDYDDIANRVDNVLIDRKTGEPVCAMDEVATVKISGNQRYDDKVDKIVRSNFGSEEKSSEEKSDRRAFGPGARLKYGLQIRDGNLHCKNMNNLPLFLLAIDRQHLREGLKNFSPTGADEYSKKMYKYFLSAMSYQIDRMVLFEKELAALPHGMKQRIDYFKKILDEEMKSK